MIRYVYLTVILIFVALAGGGKANAHEVRPAYLEIIEKQAGQFDVRWRQPANERGRLSLEPILPEGCAPLRSKSEKVSGGVYSASWSVKCDLRGGEVSIKGLDRTLTDALLRISFLDGEQHNAMLKPGARSYRIEVQESFAVPAYLQLGVEHILLGFDHLLFVLGLVLLISLRQIIPVITAFTVAHSITLAATALGWVVPASRPVEILIAMSIVLLAVEVMKADRAPPGTRPSLAIRQPWIIAAAIGLLHGFGFAGALSDIGLPEGAELGALFLFNVGVELGQLLFIAALLVVFWIAKKLPADMRQQARLFAIYAIGVAGVFWTIERVLA